MSKQVDVKQMRKELARVEQADYWWQSGKIRVGRPPAGVEVDHELRTMRVPGRGDVMVGVLRTVMEPVICADPRVQGVEGRVHMFRYRDACGGEWWFWFCAGCGAQFNRPDTGLPPLDEGCCVCGCSRAAVDCFGWHAFGECPECRWAAEVVPQPVIGPNIIERAAEIKRAREAGTLLSGALLQSDLVRGGRPEVPNAS